MVTLNSISENIAYKLGEQFNDTLKESIKNDVIAYREQFLRRDLERNFLDYNRYLQTICVELEEADISMCPDLPSGITVSQSKQKIPAPLRLKSNGATNFKYVGFINGQKSFTFATTASIPFMCSLPFQQNSIYYDFIDDRIRVFNVDHMCKIGIQMIPSDPRDIDDCNNPNVFKDDIKFPLSNDMIGDISRIIENSYRREPSNGEEVNKEEND